MLLRLGRQSNWTRFDKHILLHLITPATYIAYIIGLHREVQAGGGGVEEEAGGDGAGGHQGK